MSGIPTHYRAMLLVGAAVCHILAAGPSAQTPAGAPAKAKAAAPREWPDAGTLASRKKDAENRRLFREVAPLAVTITANFKAIDRDRNPASTKTFPGTLEFKKDDGSLGSVDVQIRTRGHMRRLFATCDFAPLRIEFARDQVKNTVFDRQTSLKLGTHCRNIPEIEQYVLLEYSAYRIFNLLTPRSFRARLTDATYIDAVTKKPLGTHHAMFIEDDDDVAKRAEGRITDRKDDLRWLDLEQFARMTVFQYLIGNTDLSVIGQHNVRLVQMPSKTVYPVPYDFDYSGLVDAVYAHPPPELKISTVRERLFRGPCRTLPELQSLFAETRAVRPAVTALYDELSALGLDPKRQRRALAYLDEFYRTIERPVLVKSAFLTDCLKHGLM
jgi:hypothetical protein